ncbi:MAG TPA: cupredoxin domain-containing protein [Terriglobia bacterium]|nr:cupredoxin domain-containing protein [Terriglobia bacterium]
MNKRRRTVLSGVILAALPITCVALRGQEAPAASSQETTIQMTARKYRFEPAVVTVKQGTRVKLTITAVDHDHGFQLAAYGINQKLPKGVPTTVEFSADNAGTFPFNCSVFCGLGHSKMKGKLVVEPASAPGSGPASTP